MACVSPDGSLTESARTLLALLETPLAPEEIARRLGRPLYQVRASLREMEEAGLVAHHEGGFVVAEPAPLAAI